MKKFPKIVVILCALVLLNWQKPCFAATKPVAVSSKMHLPKVNLMKATEMTPTPSALTLTQKKIKLSQLLKITPNAPAVNLDKTIKGFTLDVRHPVIDGQAFLQFDDANYVSPNNNSATFGPTVGVNPTIVVFLHTTGTGTYLMDFNLHNFSYSKPAQLTFAEMLYMNVQQQNAENGDSHALFLADIKDAGTGWLAFTLQSGCSTDFYGVEITQLK